MNKIHTYLLIKNLFQHVAAVATEENLILTHSRKKFYVKFVVLKSQEYAKSVKKVFQQVEALYVQIVFFRKA